jgi:hypothetical protein
LQELKQFRFVFLSFQLIQGFGNILNLEVKPLVQSLNPFLKGLLACSERPLNQSVGFVENLDMLDSLFDSETFIKELEQKRFGSLFLLPFGSHNDSCEIERTFYRIFLSGNQAVAYDFLVSPKALCSKHDSKGHHVHIILFNFLPLSACNPLADFS